MAGKLADDTDFEHYFNATSRLSRGNATLRGEIERMQFALLMIKQIATAPKLSDTVRLQGILAQVDAVLADAT